VEQLLSSEGNQSVSYEEQSEALNLSYEMIRVLMHSRCAVWDTMYSHHFVSPVTLHCLIHDYNTNMRKRNKNGDPNFR
jgi:hypothetical protein